ncbi:hypothetical protein T484DRAFT_1962510 [Baffinella frigidus]|nr:hypothetical protein T484DRAFT_1962510 [Cryptophyta sp. CCMP2293]
MQAHSILPTPTRLRWSCACPWCFALLSVARASIVACRESERQRESGILPVDPLYSAHLLSSVLIHFILISTDPFIHAFMEGTGVPRS